MMEYQRTIEMDFMGDLQDFYARYLFQQQLQQKLDDTIGDVLEECEDDIYRALKRLCGERRQVKHLTLYLLKQSKF